MIHTKSELGLYNNQWILWLPTKLEVLSKNFQLFEAGRRFWKTWKLILEKLEVHFEKVESWKLIFEKLEVGNRKLEVDSEKICSWKLELESQFWEVGIESWFWKVESRKLVLTNLEIWKLVSKKNARLRIDFEKLQIKRPMKNVVFC